MTPVQKGFSIILALPKRIFVHNRDAFIVDFTINHHHYMKIKNYN